MTETEESKPTVLIVDDEPINVQVLVNALEESYRVKVATSGAAALEIACTEHPPDLILLDIIMPGLDGYETCRRLKSDSLSSHVPVIFITVKREIQNETAGLDLGAVDYITKPFDLSVVEARVRAQLKVKRNADDLVDKACVDYLTNIGNRRRFDETLPQEWQRCGRRQVPMSLLLMDVDSFGRFNDDYGHPAGDDCLRRVALVLEKSLHRGGDLVMRYGGGKFVAVLPETDPKGAMNVAERMSRGIEQLAIVHEHSETSDIVTISFGVSTFIPSDENSPAELLEGADTMVFAAKEAGGNRCRAVVLD